MCTCLTDMFKDYLSCVHQPVPVSCHVKARTGHLQTLGHDLWFNLHIFRIITPLVHRVTILWQETTYRLCVCFRSKVTLMLWDQHLATKTPFCTRIAERALFHSFVLSCPLSPSVSLSLALICFTRFMYYMTSGPSAQIIDNGFIYCFPRNVQVAVL